MTRRTIEICDDPVFVIGAPRSGTSVIAWALHQHPDLWTSHETEFLRELFGGQRAERAYADGTARDTTWLVHHGVERAEFLAYLGLGVNALVTSRSEGKRWIDQTPGYTLLAHTLAEAFPGAKFIHMLRDGRSVVHSMLNFHRSVGRDLAERDALPHWARSFDDAVETWTVFVEAAGEFCERRPARSITVRNEELAADPESELARVLEFLGAAPHPGPAGYVRRERPNSSFGPGDDPAANRGREARWSSWTDAQRHAFVERAGPLMVHLGFAQAGELEDALSSVA